MSRGALPKAYLRIDPNIDQTHPEPAAMLLLLCAANRQPCRGRFKTKAVLENALGRAMAKRCIERGDVIQDGAGRWEVDKWDLWQEGDMTVGDRMRRLRDRRAGVDEPSLVRDTSVTAPSPDRDPPSEASRRLGVKASDALESEDVAREDDEPEMPVLTWLAQHGHYIRPGDGYHRHIVTAIERHSPAELIAEMERRSKAGVRDGDIKGLLFGAIDALDAASRPNLRALEADEGAAERAAIRSRRIEEQMWARRIERWRYAGEWHDEWGPKPEAQA